MKLDSLFRFADLIADKVAERLLQAKQSRQKDRAREKEWAVAVYRRDGFSCVACFRKGCEITAHHLDSRSAFPDREFDVDNGVTVCRRCHKAFHRLYGYGGNTAAQFIEFVRMLREDE